MSPTDEAYKKAALPVKAFAGKAGEEIGKAFEERMSSEGDIHVTTELPQAAEPPPGFVDSIVVDVAESSARFGLAAGDIYTVTAEAGGATGTAASSTSGGSVSTSAGLSTMAMVGIGAAVAAVVGAGIAIGSGSGGSSDGSSSSGSTGGTTDGQQTYVYDNPTIGGQPLDVNMGNPPIFNADEASDIYCQNQGHKEAIAYKTDTRQVVTQQIDGASSCYHPTEGCVIISQITCVN